MNTKKTVFYLLPDTEIKNRDLYICRLVEKACQNNKKVFIHSSSLTEAQTIDTQLWTFRDISFIPHMIYNDENGCLLNQALIGYGAIPPENYCDVLINLSNEIPSFYNKFQHVIEVILADDNAKIIGRKKYKIYQQNKYEMESHTL